MKEVHGVSAGNFLKAIAMIRNRLPEPTIDAGNEFALLAESLFTEPNSKAHILDFLSLLSAFSAVILADIAAIDPEFSPNRYLDNLTDGVMIACEVDE